MEREGQEYYEGMIREAVSRQVSRAGLFKVAGAGLAAAGLAGFLRPHGTEAATTSYPFYPQVPGTYTPESVQSILNIAVTAEQLAVTILSAALANRDALKLSGLLLSVVAAALVEEQSHLDFLAGAGAQPVTSTFTVPNPAILTDQTTFLQTIETAETIFVAAYMTAVREFAEQGQPTLAKYAYQLGAVEAEHRVLARAALAMSSATAAGGGNPLPPNNKAFETDLFVYVADAATLLTQLGFIGGTGAKLSYPGPGPAAQASILLTQNGFGEVIQRTPNNATVSAGPDTIFTGTSQTLTTTLSGSVEVPAGSPTGQGTATVTLDALTGQVTFSITVKGIILPALASHIHKGVAGQAGPIVIPFTAPNAAGQASGTVTADVALVRDIILHPSNYYVNVHTSDFPAGAVRGQLG